MGTWETLIILFDIIVILTCCPSSPLHPYHYLVIILKHLGDNLEGLISCSVKGYAQGRCHQCDKTGYLFRILTPSMAPRLERRIMVPGGWKLIDRGRPGRTSTAGTEIQLDGGMCHNLLQHSRVTMAYNN